MCKVKVRCACCGKFISVTSGQDAKGMTYKCPNCHRVIVVKNRGNSKITRIVDPN